MGKQTPYTDGNEAGAVTYISISNIKVAFRWAKILNMKGKTIKLLGIIK